MTIPPALLQAFESVYNYIEAAREIVHAGQTPDMMGLDQRVSALCTDIELTDPEVRQECLPKLDQLLRKLDLVEADIKGAQSAVENSSEEDPPQ